jgi:solute carrier family 35 (adenosine 3'-phospho 5'-phosphosulfate transporter), member B3
MDRYGILQEHLYTSFKYGFFISFLQFIMYALISGIQYYFEEMEKKIKIRKYLTISVLSVLSMALGYEALSFISYPTKIIFKSSKLLGVILIGVLFLGKKYKKTDYISSILIAIGLYLMYMESNQSTNQSHFDIRGVLLMLGAIISDSFVGNLQDDLLHHEQSSANEVIFYSHSIGVFYLFFLCILFDQFLKPSEISFLTL